MSSLLPAGTWRPGLAAPLGCGTFPSSGQHIPPGLGCDFTLVTRPRYAESRSLRCFSAQESAHSSSGWVGTSAGLEDSNLSWEIKIFGGFCPDASIPRVRVPSFPSLAPDPSITNTHWWASNLLCSSVTCLLGARLGLPCNLKPLWLSHLAFSCLLLALCVLLPSRKSGVLQTFS